MIDYKLAKELKDNGLKQEMKIGSYGYNPSGLYQVIREDGIYELGDDEVYLPTLSELIEACGDRFDSLIKIKMNKGYIWSARSYNYPIQESSKTPEEAVAKLWLVLNK